MISQGKIVYHPGATARSFSFCRLSDLSNTATSFNYITGVRKFDQPPLELCIFVVRKKIQNLFREM